MRTVFAATFLLLASTPLVALANPRPAGKAASQPFPTFGISLTPPADWQELPRDIYKTIVQWVSPDSRPDDPKAVIMVEAAKPKSGDGQENATGLAKGWGGRVIDPQTSLDGEKAWRVQAAASGQGLQPAEAIVTIHDGFMYLIMGGATPGRSCHEQIEAIRAGWKWVPIEAPARHLEFRDKPLVAFGGKASINFPAMMHTYPTGQPGRVLDLGLSDLRKGEPGFLAFVQILNVPKGDTFDVVKGKLAKGMRETLKLPSPEATTAPSTRETAAAFGGKIELTEDFAWHDLRGATRREVTQPIRVRTADPKDNPGSLLWGLVQLNGNQYVLINFTLATQDPSESRAFEQAARDMVASIAPIAEEPAAGPKPADPFAAPAKNGSATRATEGAKGNVGKPSR